MEMCEVITAVSLDTKVSSFLYTPDLGDVILLLSHSSPFCSLQITRVIQTVSPHLAHMISPYRHGQYYFACTFSVTLFRPIGAPLN